MLGVIAAGLLWMSPVVIAAQQTEEKLVEKLDSLRPMLEAAEAELQAFEAREEEAARQRAAAEARVDTLTVGQLTIVTPSDQIEIARELFGSVWAQHFGSVGYSPALEEVVFTFQWSDELSTIHVTGAVRPVEMRTKRPRPAVEARIRDVVSTSIAADLGELGTNVGRWGAGNPLGPRTLTSTYRIVAMTESQASRSCLAGEAGSCATAMGLGGKTGLEQIEAWYSPEERRSLVAGRNTLRSRTINRDATRCVEEDQLPVCDRILVETRRDLTPFAAPVRETFVAFALEAGGEGAWDRLVEDPDMDVVEAIEYASLLPLEEVVSGWRERLVASRPDTYEKLFPKSGLALLWSFFFAALALRSTRWRLG
jgi:hypothetical protein